MATDLSALFGALADTRRRAILDLLQSGRLTVNKIAEHFSVSRPAISRHLRVLRETGLVAEEKRGRERFYTLDPSAIGEAVDHLQPYLSWGGKGAAPPSGQPATRPAAYRRPPSRKPRSGKSASVADDSWRCW